MAKRDLTLVEIQAKLDQLKDKVSEEGMELYTEIKDKVSTLAAASAEKVNEIMDELGPKFEALKYKVSTEGQALLEDIKSKFSKLASDIQEEIEDLHEEFQEEIEEYKQVGLKAWIKSNPKTAAGIGIVIVLAIAAVVAVVTGVAGIGATPSA